MKTKYHNDLHATGKSHRARYTRPQLREFGPVGALTQAGTGAMGENPMNPMNPMQRL